MTWTKLLRKYKRENIFTNHQEETGLITSVTYSKNLQNGRKSNEKRRGTKLERSFGEVINLNYTRNHRLEQKEHMNTILLERAIGRVQVVGNFPK